MLIVYMDGKSLRILCAMVGVFSLFYSVLTDDWKYLFFSILVLYVLIGDKIC